MPVDKFNDVLYSDLSHVNGIATADISHINGETTEAQWGLDWNNVSGTSPQTTNTETSGKTGTLHIDMTGIFSNGFQGAQVLVNSVSQENFSQSKEIATLSVNDGDDIYFNFQSNAGTISGTVTVKEDNSSGDTVDTFTVSVSA